MIWMNECGRKEIIATQFKGDGKNVAAIAKACGAAWSAMSEADKKPWNEKAEKDKLRHAKEMESYVPSETSGPVKKKGKKGKKEKDPNKPKRGMSAYFMWLNENRAKIMKEQGFSGKDIAKIGKFAGEAWGKMSEADKAPFVKKAEADKQRYEREMANYDGPAKVRKSKKGA